MNGFPPQKVFSGRTKSSPDTNTPNKGRLLEQQIGAKAACFYFNCDGRQETFDLRRASDFAISKMLPTGSREVSTVRKCELCQSATNTAKDDERGVLKTAGAY